ncbi:type II secretion system protein M [Aestuariibacter sp. AA17]|uniref:Type II secretion system protein M n=1 Tax=Fluctibacter corallii TaxID=2984329 RepID=A0ABT3AAV2_9ALTE|nr:type II secretion system protein M [Aestuariibacter sp. AA17]MCV2885809.1 type II secretion system protein M [Aestuariibacter sp. AA17]
MKELLKKYQQLSEREQYMVIACSVVFIIGMFYWLVWSPLNTAIERNETAVKAKQSELSWVKKNAAKAIQLKRSSRGGAQYTGSLTQAVNQTAGRYKITISRMQPQNDILKVWVDEVPFNDVVTWLQSLESMGITIIDIDLAQADAPGLVKIRNLQLGKS